MVEIVKFFSSPEGVLLIGSFILFLSILASKVGSRFGLPALLLFLVVGMLFGREGVGIVFDDPHAAQFIGMMALSIILFAGGMDTKFSDTKPIAKQGILLATLGVLITTFITGIFIHHLSVWIGSEAVHLSYSQAFLLAAIMASTDSASVFSILRGKNIKLKQKIGPLLEFESGCNDPMGYLLTIFLISYIQQGGIDFGQAIVDLLVQLSVGAVIGYLMAKGTVYLMNRINIDNASLYPILLLTLAFLTFSVATLFKGNGYLAVYLAGLIIGNSEIIHKKSTQTFFDGFSWLWQIVMFLMLGLLIKPNELMTVAPIGVTIGLVMILVARPVSVFISLLPFKNISFKGKLFISWVGLRGAVPIIFATYPLIAGVSHAHLFFNIVFFITILSLSIQGTTMVAFAKKLKLIEDPE